MTGMTEEERILDLLTEKLERPLSPTERAELDRLLVANPKWRTNDLSYAAAAIDNALAPPLLDMPDDVMARVIGRVLGDATKGLDVTQPQPMLRLARDDDASPARATGATTPTGSTSTTGSTGTSGRSNVAPVATSNAPSNVRPLRARAVVVAPWLAVAAAVFVAVVGWWPRLDGPSTAGALAREVAAAPDALKVAWAQTADPLGTKVTGDVVWSPSKQAGVMRFAGLPANDPTKAQYQLWIFDAERDERYPVDGGVFDVTDGETLVAIQARVPVGKVTLFAITLERPGGVVVSTRERLVALGKV